MALNLGDPLPGVSESLERRSSAVRVLTGQLVAQAAYRIIKRVMDSRGLEQVLLKGPHLGAIVYDKAWERSYGDLDVLVRPVQFQEALAALVENGFSLEAGPADRSATIESYYNRALISPHGWRVELHRAYCAYNLYSIDYEALFSRAVSFRFGQEPALGLALEDLLVHLVIHAAKSKFRTIQPKHVRDVALLVARQPIQWEIFLTRCREAGCCRAACVMLTAATKIHGAVIPDEVLRRLRPSLALRWWLGLWLTMEHFPLFRWPWLPLWLGRLIVAPVIVDGFWHGMASGLRFLSVRVRDVW